MKRLMISLLLCLSIQIAQADPFDHAVWDTLLHRHVVVLGSGEATALDYQALAQSQDQLNSYLAQLSDVRQEGFEQWPDAAQLAFLINAYNAWTVALILTRYPDLDSIKDLGGLYSSPWEKRFIPLLGQIRSLDDIEHGMIRGSGRFPEPRIHFALNCASVGCPALRPEAYRGEVLAQQLETQTRLFLSDRSRNRLRGEVLELSPIFKWYREDFEQGWRDTQSLPGFLLHYASALDLTPAVIEQLQANTLAIAFLDYDWRLNDIRREGRKAAIRQ